MTATALRISSVLFVIFVMSTSIPAHIIPQRGDVYNTPVYSNTIPGQINSSPFYLSQNFTVGKGVNLTIRNKNLIVLSSDLLQISLTVYGHLILENSTVRISNQSINRVSSLNVSVKGHGSIFELENSSLNYSGSLYMLDARVVIANSVVGENKGSNANEPSKALKVMAFGSNVTVSDSRIGGQIYLNHPGNFKAASLYGVNYNSQYPDSTPGNMTTRSLINSTINPRIDLLNLSISYKDLVNESSGVYFYLNTKAGILYNISLPYELGDGMKTVQMNLNVSSLSENLSFFLNRSDFWLSKEFNSTDGLGIFNMSLSLWSNSWVKLFGTGFFSILSENSNLYFRNSTTDLNENPFDLSDGAHSYRKDFVDLINSTAVFVDTSVYGQEGFYSPIIERNSTFVAAREIELNATDHEYEYPVSDLTIKPLTGTDSPVIFSEADRILSNFTSDMGGFDNSRIVSIPYFFDFQGSEYNFTDFNYTADNGDLTGIISVAPFPYMVSSSLVVQKIVNVPLRSVKLESSFLSVSGRSLFSIVVSGAIEYGKSIELWLNVENETEGFNETLTSNFSLTFNLTYTVSENITGIIPGTTYSCSIQKALMEGGEPLIIKGLPISSKAYLNGSLIIGAASLIYSDGGNSTLSSTIVLDSSHSVNCIIELLNDSSVILNRSLTLFPGSNTISFPAGRIVSLQGIMLRANAPLLSSNASNTIYPEVIDSAEPREYNVTFRERGLPAGTVWEVQINGSDHIFLGKEGNVSLFSGNYSITAISPEGYRSVCPSEIEVMNSSVSVYINFTQILFRLEFINTGIESKAWKILIDGSIYYGYTEYLNLSLPYGTYNYEIIEPEGYYATNGSSIVTLSANTTINIAAKKETGILSIVTGTMDNQRFVIGLSLITILSAVFLMHRRKHRWKIL